MHYCVFLLLVIAGIANSNMNTYLHEHAPGEKNNQPGRKAVCNLQSPNENFNIAGKVFMTQFDPIDPVTIMGYITVSTQEDISGNHGFHIHQFSVPSGICTEAGGHYNPHGKEHGGPGDTERHVGDLGNISFEEYYSYGSTSTFTSNIYMTDSQVTLYGDYSVVGRAIVIHMHEDDLGKGGFDDSRTTGHAGARIGCCNILFIKHD